MRLLRGQHCLKTTYEEVSNYVGAFIGPRRNRPGRNVGRREMVNPLVEDDVDARVSNPPRHLVTEFVGVCRVEKSGSGLEESYGLSGEVVLDLSGEF